ncbi:peptidoglycan DD-metalloendopeptidase family protein [Sanyastnella coralliicola]|uniref:peptidoglycan DD-metalloendopeptidase family protein n=1 Tax=Sanyastnella coralliicola TaxID=3069118 RepID=UPI0027B99022|nr:peptidoglycan DD-metalloendopeptidase family protein [Longitalea sp. SCSIO 12813]
MRLLYLSFILLLFAQCAETSSPQTENQPTEPEVPVYVADMHYGFDFNNWRTVDGKINNGDVLSGVLSPLGVTAVQVDQLIKRSDSIFDVRKIRPNHKWVCLFEEDSLAKPSYFIYERNAKDYVVFDLSDSIQVWQGSKPVVKELRAVRGTITSSLYNALDDAGAPAELALEMSSIYAWTIDFYRLQKEDAFELLYEEELVDGVPYGKQNVLAAHFLHNGVDRKAYFYDQDTTYGYFDEEGGSLRKAFLKAPVEFSRISSRYTKKRFHPVLKRYKSHLGTDYAAPRGTPIVAVGDGTVTKSSYTAGNGKYVKIRHNGTYETQYLHMSKRAVKAGDVVKQGDVIGYVGSTGLATGPHVCFRFWKNGQQIDHMGEEFPPSDPIGEAQMDTFMVVIGKLESLLQETLPEVVPEAEVTVGDSLVEVGVDL